MILGKFHIRSGKVRVSDPCYGKDVWCSGEIENVKNGAWGARLIQSDKGDWGVRNAVLIAHHQDNLAIHDKGDWQKVGFEVGVDSGQAGIYDLTEYHGGEDDYGQGGWYDTNCDITLDRHIPEGEPRRGAGCLPDQTGVVSCSGFGDGGYDCFTIKDEDGEVTAIKIDFGVLSEENVCDDCGESFESKGDLNCGICEDCEAEQLRVEEEAEAWDKENEED